MAHSKLENLFSVDIAHTLHGGMPERFADLDAALLLRELNPNDPAAKGGLLFNLFDHVGVALDTRRAQSDRNGGSWYGEQAGDHALLAISGLAGSAGPLVSGSAVIDGLRYALAPAGPGRVRIRALDRAAGPAECKTCHAPSAGFRLPDTLRFRRVPQQAVSYEQGEEAEAVANIKVLAIYSPRTADAVGKNAWGGSTLSGKQKIELLMHEAKMATDTAFANSNIAATVEIVCHSLDLAELDGMDVEKAMQAVIDADEKKNISAAAIVQLRRQEKAHCVAILLSENRTSIGGLAFLPQPPDSDTDSLTSALMTIALLDSKGDSQVGGSPNAVFSHELGHLLGAWHDRQTTSSRNGSVLVDASYGWARGYRLQGAGDEVVTVMGYGTPILHYSSPEIRYGGHPTGVAVGQLFEADTARLLRLTTKVVARRYAADGGDHVDLKLEVGASRSTRLLAGRIIPDELGPHAANGKVTLTAVPFADRSTFGRWIIDGDEKSATTEPTVTLTMDRAHTAKAHFEMLPAKQGSVTLQIVPPEAVTRGVRVRCHLADGPEDRTLEPGGRWDGIERGTDVELAQLAGAATSDGYASLGWQLDGRPLAEADGCFRSSGEDQVIAARFIRLEFDAVPFNWGEVRYSPAGTPSLYILPSIDGCEVEYWTVNGTRLATTEQTLHLDQLESYAGKGLCVVLAHLRKRGEPAPVDLVKLDGKVTPPGSAVVWADSMNRVEPVPTSGRWFVKGSRIGFGIAEIKANYILKAWHTSPPMALGLGALVMYEIDQSMSVEAELVIASLTQVEGTDADRQWAAVGQRFVKRIAVQLWEGGARSRKPLPLPGKDIECVLTGDTGSYFHDTEHPAKQSKRFTGQFDGNGRTILPPIVAGPVAGAVGIRAYILENDLVEIQLTAHVLEPDPAARANEADSPNHAFTAKVTEALPDMGEFIIHMNGTPVGGIQATLTLNKAVGNAPVALGDTQSPHFLIAGEEAVRYQVVSRSDEGHVGTVGIPPIVAGSQPGDYWVRLEVDKQQVKDAFEVIGAHKLTVTGGGETRRR
ncbi:M12 family metallo-peptidase [Chitinimonas koreensis]|uniref:M12 family metallo-peptidase n=2 Tax=Chitinimonas koreensis TaxID=356302 RepID=UPI0012F93965|nr:M12 family metallo-peptidase [Chitinimonas koreensis]